MDTRNRLSEIPPRVVERVQTRVVTDLETGCLISTYSVGSHGYAQVGWRADGERMMTLCHRVTWIAEHGPIADGLTVDHTCKQRRCVNVAHLRLLTNYDNARRTHGRDWPLGQCAQGHPDSELVVQPDGRNRCQECSREQSRGWAERNRRSCADCAAPVGPRSMRCRSCAGALAAAARWAS